MMQQEMAACPPLNHLLSTYIIRPIAFDKDPFVLPKAAVLNKAYKGGHYNPNYKQDAPIERNRTQKPAEETKGPVDEFDDFETMTEKPKRKHQPREARQPREFHSGFNKAGFERGTNLKPKVVEQAKPTQEKQAEAPKKEEPKSAPKQVVQEVAKEVKPE